MPQQKILEDEFSLAGPQRTAANTARYLAIIGFWASLNLDDVVKRAAMRTFKKRLPGGRNVRRFARDSHGTMTFCGPDWAKMPPVSGVDSPHLHLLEPTARAPDCIR